MELGSRIVCITKKYKGKTGTIISIYDEDGEGKPYTVRFDDGIKEYFKIDEIIEIDDITNIGEIEFKEGMYVYDVHLNLVGKLVEVKKVEDLIMHKVEWENGKTSYTYLVEEYNYIVTDKRYLIYGTRDKFEILMKKSINPHIDLDTISKIQSKESQKAI